jgi:hypothetical protein
MNLGAPDISDYSESNPFVKIASISAGLFEQLGYYIDFQARESNIYSCRKIVNARKIAKANDYRIKCATPASVLITFVRTGGTGAFTIPSDTICTSTNGIKFKTVSDLVFDTTQEFGSVSAKQINGTASIVINPSYIGAIPSAFFEVEEPTTGGKIADGTVGLLVNSIAWDAVETLTYSHFDETHFVQTTNQNGVIRLETGDGILGAIVPSGVIEASYSLTEGLAGNVGANTITTTNYIIPSGMGTLALTNKNVATGGTDFETLERLKYRIPKLINTKLRAVTKLDYEDVAVLFGGVVNAGVEFQCSKKISIYIVPEGGGIASPSLLSDLENYLEDKKIIGRSVKAYPAGTVAIILGIDVTAKSGYSNTIVTNNVTTNLLNFLSYETQKIRGEVQLSDIYEIVETTDGVRNSKINVMNAHPYARPIGSTTTVLDWSVETLSNSATTNKWKIRFINSTQYQIFRNNIFIAVQNVGTAYTIYEILINIAAAGYVLGDEYEFYTYNYYGSIQLAEPSVPISQASDLTINTTGGY